MTVPVERRKAKGGLSTGSHFGLHFFEWMSQQHSNQLGLKITINFLAVIERRKTIDLGSWGVAVKL
jgi:hypothetical protein